MNSDRFLHLKKLTSEGAYALVHDSPSDGEPEVDENSDDADEILAPNVRKSVDVNFPIGAVGFSNNNCMDHINKEQVEEELEKPRCMEHARFRQRVMRF